MESLRVQRERRLRKRGRDSERNKDQAMSEAGAAVVGSGPNGLAAAITFARAGVPVTVFEAQDSPGGGMRTAEWVEPGVVHDICSAVHPLALATGFFREFELTRRVQFAVPEVSYAHPLDGGAVLAYRDLSRTADELGRDGAAYTRLFESLVRRIDGVIDFALGGSMLRLPRDLWAALAVARRTIEQGSVAWNLRFRDDAAPALLTGALAHNIGALPNTASAAVGLILAALAHASGWAVPMGGSGAIAQAMVADLEAHGGRVVTGHAVTEITELDAFQVKVFDTSAHAFANIGAARLPQKYARALKRFRAGDAVTKVDFVLDAPITWADERVALAPTVHLGATRAELVASERAVARGEHPERPFVLLAQPDTVDPTRNAPDSHAVWAYTHVPRGSDVNVEQNVIAQIERFAPGFRESIRAVRVTTAAELSAYNANYIGGDIAGGAVSLKQLLARPVLSSNPWKTPLRGVYLASASTSPGPGVHGLAGWYAARSALRDEYDVRAPNLGLTH